MIISTIDKTMLYCPKCQKTYAEGSQRFCLNEGERLVPLHAKSANRTGGVFTNVLRRKTGEAPSNFSPLPKLSPAGAKISPQPDFHSLAESRVFKTEPESDFKLKLPNAEPQPLSNESAESPAKSDDDLLETFIADYRDEPDEPLELNLVEAVEEPAKPIAEIVSPPEIAVGQLVNRRFLIVEQIGEDESGVSFLATDENESGKRCVLKVLNVGDDPFVNEVFADERKALLKLKHPNLAETIDAGETADGEPFLVAEAVEGETVEEHLKKHGQFNVLRAARVVRQIADALGEAHRNNVLHRNLIPSNVVLSIDENGAERVRVKNFGTAIEKLNAVNLLYKSPEQVEGKIANVAGDTYSLGVIAYQMLTNRLPFVAGSVGELLKAQREGVKIRPSDLRFDLPTLIDEILKKALSFHSFDRHLKAGDFGDAFFSEIIANLPLETEDEEVAETPEIEAPPISEKPENAEDLKTEPIAEPAMPVEKIPTPAFSPVVAKTPIHIPAARAKEAPGAVKATEELAWEKRSSEMPNESSPRRILLALLGVAALLVMLIGGWYYFINRPTEKPAAPVANQIAVQPATDIEKSPLSETNLSAAATPTPDDIEAPPIPRQISQPPNTFYFQNSKAALKGEAAKNYLGFSLYYPSDWTLNPVQNNFLDVSKKAANGLPVEQLLVSYYNSKGTFKLDAPEIFAAQVANTNETLKKILPNYRMVSEGKRVVNNGWQAYEVKFEGASKTAGGETIKIWGKRLFIPTAIRGMKNGYVITMLATSLLKDVQSVEDVGVKGELSMILETFEPNQNF